MSDVPELELPTGERVQVSGRIVIGRGSDADVVLTDAEASRRHAELALEGGLPLLSDLESRNGTMVNGQRVTAPRALRDGDIVRIGQTQMVFHAPAGQQEPEPVAQPDDPALTVVAPRVQQTVRQQSVPGPSSPLQVLGRITRAIAGMDDARQIADAATSAIKDEYGCEGASLVLVDRSSGALYFASVASDSPSLKLITLNPGQGIVGRAIELGQPALVVDVSKDPGHAVSVDRSLGFTSKSIIAAPVTSPGGDVLGALEAINPVGKPAFDADDLEFLVLVATALGPALAKATQWGAIEQERAALARVSGIRRQYVATSPGMVRLVMEAAALNEAKTPVYLAGEPGTGRSTLARLIHEASGADGGFDIVAGGTPLGPRGGTFLIPEVERLSAEEQSELAALLGEGGRRVFVTGSGSLLSLLSSGAISPELHERLEAGQLIMPPLRSRLEELEPLVEHFAGEVTARLGREPFAFSEDALDRLREHRWPGNVRELRDIVTRVGILARETVIEPATLLQLTPEFAEAVDPPKGVPRPLERRRAALLEQAIAEAQGGDEADRVAAAQTLGRSLSPEVTDVLLALLDDESAPVRAAAAGALSGRAAAAAGLASHLEQEVDLGVALTLMEALAATGQVAEHPVVARALRAGDARMRRLSMRALRRAGPAREAAEAVREDPDPTVRIEALAALIEAGEPLEAELDALAEDGEASVRVAACEALGELGLATDRLLALTANGDRPVRVAAIRALGASQSQDARSVLLELLSDVTVSGEAATALGKMGAAEAVPRLVALLSAPEAPLATRRAVLEALGRIPSEQSTGAITEALADPALVDTALEALGDQADVPLEQGAVEARTLQLLRAGSSSPEAAVESLEALVGLAARVDDSAAMVRATEAGVDDPETRELALEFLLEMDDAAALPMLLAHPESAPVNALEAFGEASIPALLAALDSAQEPVAAEALAGFGPGAVPRLLACLGDPKLARAAHRALLEVGPGGLPYLVSAIEAAGPEELPALLQVLGQVAPGRLANYAATFLGASEPAVRYGAMIALGNLPDPRSESELLARLDSDDPATAMLATLALGRIQSAEAFEALAVRVGEGDRRSQYALAGAVNEYNLRQGPVLAMVTRMVREGLPFSSGALESAVGAGAVTEPDVVAALASSAVPEAQKVRLLSAIGRLDPGSAVPLLLAVLRVRLAGGVLSAAAAALTRHEVAAREEIASLVLEPSTRDAGLAVLRQMHDPRALMSVLRKIAPALEQDAELRRAMRSMGDLVLGPLIDVISENWDLASLSLLWQLTELVEQESP